MTSKSDLCRKLTRLRAKQARLQRHIDRIERKIERKTYLWENGSRQANR